MVGLGGAGGEALGVPPVTRLCSPQVGGVTIQTLYSEAPDENAKQLCEWMEQGAFKAMNDGYLVGPACQRPVCTRIRHARTHWMAHNSRQDKCVLVISADAEEKVVLEAWSLSIGWSGELRVQVNDQERVLGPPSDKVKTGAISQTQACHCGVSSTRTARACDRQSDAPWALGRCSKSAPSCCGRCTRCSRRWRCCRCASRCAALPPHSRERNPVASPL